MGNNNNNAPPSYSINSNCVINEFRAYSLSWGLGIGISLLILFILVLGGGIGFLVILFKDKKSVSSNAWNPYVEDIEKIARTSNRGTIISMLLTSCAIIQGIMKKCGAAETMLLLLFGFFMNAIIGFLGDQGLGKDDGFSLKYIVKNLKSNNGTTAVAATTIKYLLGCLTSPEFWRFIITVFLDMFISMPIQMIIVAVFNCKVGRLTTTYKDADDPSLIFKGVGALVLTLLEHFDNILQSFVGFITFLAYTNDTRFRWAYPGNDVDPSLLISTGTIKLATAIAAVVYLIVTVVHDFNIIDLEANYPKVVGSALGDTLPKKLFFTILIIVIMTGGSMNPSPKVPEGGPYKNPFSFFINTLKSFMNYEPSRYTVGPLENHKIDEFWKLGKVDVLKDKDTFEDTKNPDCSPGGFDLCLQDPNKQYDIVYDKENGNIKKLGGKKNDLPCLIPTRDLGSKCYDDDKNFQQHKHSDKLALPINMAVYMKPARTIVTKYDLINNYKIGFFILCFYMTIGFIVPFLPFGFIYSEKEYKKINQGNPFRKWFKPVAITVLVGSFLAIINPFFGIGAKNVDIDELKKSEIELLKKMKE